MVDGQDFVNTKAGTSGGLDAPSPSGVAPTSEWQNTENVQEEMPVAVTTDISPQGSSEWGVAQEATPGPTSDVDVGRMHELIEAVVNEKWDDLMGNLGNLTLWKERVDTNITAVKQELVRLSDRFENLQNSIVGRVKIYDDTLSNIHDEMKALEKVFEKILEPLVMNIKELERITQDMKHNRKI